MLLVESEGNSRFGNVRLPSVSVRKLKVVGDSLEQLRPRVFVDPKSRMEIGRGWQTGLEKTNQVRLQHCHFHFAARPLDEGQIGHDAGRDHPQAIAV